MVARSSSTTGFYRVRELILEVSSTCHVYIVRLYGSLLVVDIASGTTLKKLSLKIIINRRTFGGT